MQNQNTKTEQYLPESCVSDMTGISVATLRNHHWLGKGIPYIKIGRTIRYQESEVLNYLDELKVKTKPPLKHRSPITEVESATGLN